MRIRKSQETKNLLSCETTKRIIFIYLLPWLQLKMFILLLFYVWTTKYTLKWIDVNNCFFFHSNRKQRNINEFSSFLLDINRFQWVNNSFVLVLSRAKIFHFELRINLMFVPFVKNGSADSRQYQIENLYFLKKGIKCMKEERKCVQNNWNGAVKLI